MRSYPHLSFQIPVTVAEIYVFPSVITFAKNTSILEGTVLKDGYQLRTRYLCVVYDFVGKADFRRGFRNPKRELRVTAHFLRDN